MASPGGTLSNLAAQRLPGPAMMVIQKGVGFRLLATAGKNMFVRLGKIVPDRRWRHRCRARQLDAAPGRRQRQAGVPAGHGPSARRADRRRRRSAPPEGTGIARQTSFVEQPGPQAPRSVRPRRSPCQGTPVSRRWSPSPARSASRSRPGGPSIGERAGAVPRMVRATFSGEYIGVSKGRLMLMLAAAGYLVSPLDLIPEAVMPDPRPRRRRARAQLARDPPRRGDRELPRVGARRDAGRRTGCLGRRSRLLDRSGWYRRVGRPPGTGGRGVAPDGPGGRRLLTPSAAGAVGP